MDQDLREAALEYHRMPTPGKISVVPTTAMATQRDLALAYSPGVAEPCLAIAEDALQADVLTARSGDPQRVEAGQEGHSGRQAGLLWRGRGRAGADADA